MNKTRQAIDALQDSQVTEALKPLGNSFKHQDLTNVLKKRLELTQAEKDAIWQRRKRGGVFDPYAYRGG
jgi:hypothetical protein